MLPLSAAMNSSMNSALVSSSKSRTERNGLRSSSSTRSSFPSWVLQASTRCMPRRMVFHLTKESAKDLSRGVGSYFRRAHLFPLSGAYIA